MSPLFPITRHTLRQIAAASLWIGLAGSLAAQVVRPAAPSAPHPQAFGPRPSGMQMGPQRNGAAVRGEHLNQWMQDHHNMSPQDQQRALQREPGFNQLPQQTQQRMEERLNRLNSMPEPQRQKVLERGEAMERLNMQQRVQVRSAMGQLGALPEDRRRAVARSFRELRSMPPAQQNQMLNSPQYHQQFSDEERGTLGNLLSVSPLLPQNR